MGKLSIFINWLLLRTLHVWIPIVIFILVFIIGRSLPNNLRYIFILRSGIVMQCIGVTILLIILDKNIFSIKGSKIIDELMKWIQDFPFIKKSVEITPTGGALITGGGSVYAFGRKKGVTIEERIDILEIELDGLRKQIIDSKEELLCIMNKKEHELNKKFESVDSNINKIQKNLEDVVIGGYKWQIFSACLIFLGLILTIMAT